MSSPVDIGLCVFRNHHSINGSRPSLGPMSTLSTIRWLSAAALELCVLHSYLVRTGAHGAYRVLEVAPPISRGLRIRLRP